MKIFIDSADIEEIEQAQSYGFLDGVTTNPSLLKKAAEKHLGEEKKGGIYAYLKQLLKITKGTPVSLEVISATYEDMLREGLFLYRRLNGIAKNVVIKVPVSTAFKEHDKNKFDGIRVIKELSRRGIPVNCTLIFTPEQALLAAKAGAVYVSPFAGRIDDDLRKRNNVKFDKTDYFRAGGLRKGRVCDDNGISSGVDLVNQIAMLFAQHGIKTEILAASLRNSRQVREVAIAGADIATLPFTVIEQLLDHHKTREGMQKFTDDTVPEYADLLADKR